jgi:3-methyladenine DNA glycosylase AlkD
MPIVTMESFVDERLRAVADADRAGAMAAYMKTDMAFHGVPKPLRGPILSELVRAFPARDRGAYEDGVRRLWALPHREEKYLAIGYARGFDTFVDAGSVPLYRDLIVEGAWWDLVDETAARLVGRALAKDRDSVTPVVWAWATHDDMWLRRSAIICQLGHRSDTDVDLLSHACVENLADTEFFIRKAIGWALRDYARSAPAWVRSFVESAGDRMSPLSRREAMKHL